ncbi:MAG: hypothetical protein M1831_005226 [Alyxoria varia]|nr:MAG: hypothetical protein M1831_005226 [Alyxoria varia]
MQQNTVGLVAKPGGQATVPFARREDGFTGRVLVEVESSLPFGGKSLATATAPLLQIPKKIRPKLQDQKPMDESRPRQEQQEGQSGDGEKRKGKTSRASKPQDSLRRVALEAERSRGVLKGDQREEKGPPTPGIETRDVTAYCAAEQYNILAVAQILRKNGYKIDPANTQLYPQVIHVQYPPIAEANDDNTANTLTSESNRSKVEIDDGVGDIFIFPSGTVVAWNVDEAAARAFISGTIQPAAEGAFDRPETEDLEYYEDAKSEKSGVVAEKIRLGTKMREDGANSQHDMPSLRNNANIEDGDILQKDNTALSPSLPASTSPRQPPRSSDDDMLAGSNQAANLALSKIAFSSGLARSTKLAVLESALDAYIHSTRGIPALLSKGARLPFSRSFILRKTGELLSIRAQLNLSPGSSGADQLTDNLPDIFWDSEHSLGLETCFGQVTRALDIGVRVRALNEKMDYAQEIASVLRENLSEKHGLKLEWAIILLICVEVVFETRNWLAERHERADPDSTEGMLRRVLARELERNGS